MMGVTSPPAGPGRPGRLSEYLSVNRAHPDTQHPDTQTPWSVPPWLRRGPSLHPRFGWVGSGYQYVALYSTHPMPPSHPLFTRSLSSLSQPLPTSSSPLISDIQLHRQTRLPLHQSHPRPCRRYATHCPTRASHYLPGFDRYHLCTRIQHRNTSTLSSIQIGNTSST